MIFSVQTIRTKWSYCCGSSLAGPPLTPKYYGALKMLHYHYCCC